MQAPGLPAVHPDDRIAGRLPLLGQPADQTFAVPLQEGVGPEQPSEEEAGGLDLLTELASQVFRALQKIECRAAEPGLPARGDGITGPSPRRALYTLTGEMKERYLLPVLSGEKKTCFAQTEPDAGSDPGGMRTTAVKDGNHYVIKGVKRFITGAGKADFVQLLAATDRSNAVTEATVSTVGFVAGGVLVATGLVMIVAAPANEPAKTGAQLLPVLGPGQAGLQLRGAF